MVAVDTNILVRVIVKDVPDQTKWAQGVLNKAKAGSLYLDRLILAELNYVMKSMYRYERVDIIKSIRGFIQDNTFYVSDKELVELTINLFETEKPLSFEDCWLLALKQSGKVEKVLTFDNNLLKCLKT